MYLEMLQDATEIMLNKNLVTDADKLDVVSLIILTFGLIGW